MQRQQGIVWSIRFIDEKISFINLININNPCYNLAFDKKVIANYSVFINYKGKLSLNSDSHNKTILKENDLVLLKPFDEFNINTIANEDAEYCIATFSSELFSDDEQALLRIFNYNPNNNIYHLNDIENGDLIVRLFERTKKYSKLNFKKGHFIAMLKAILSELCIYFDKSSPETAEKYSREYDAEIYNYILSNFNKNPSIKSVAQKFYASPSYVNKVCRHFYQMPYRQMIIDIRMWYSRGLIEMHRDIKLKKISEMCGYAEYSAFYKAYLNYFGITPKEDYELYLKTGRFYNKYIK